MRLTDVVEVRAIKGYSFDDNHGVSVWFENIVPYKEKDEVGHIPVKHTFKCESESSARNIFENMFPVIPGEYEMSFELRANGKGQMKQKILGFIYQDKETKTTKKVV